MEYAPVGSLAESDGRFVALAEQLNVSATESTWIWLLPPPLADMFLLFYMFSLLLKPAVPSGCRFGFTPNSWAAAACGAAERGHLNRRLERWEVS